MNRILILLTLLSAGCASTLYIPDQSVVTADATLEQLNEGRKLYIENCSSCHVLYAPGKYKREEWQVQVDEMQERSHIKLEQKNLILKYLWNAPVAVN
jgi:mono/diheme cytochrome c family protein